MANRFSVIYGLARSPELLLSDEDLHALVYSITNKNSLKKISDKQLQMVIIKLQELKDSARKQKKELNYTNRGKRGTQYQRRKIYMLMKELGWNENRVQGLAKKLTKVDAIEWLNYQQCSNLIEAMKDILKREKIVQGE